VYATHSSAAQVDGFLHVYFLDIGQGDSELIVSPTGNRVLIDGGPDGAVLGQLSNVMPFFEQHLDAVIATHPHIDHIGGLMPVLEQYDVGSIVQASISFRSAAFSTWMHDIESEQAKIIWAVAGTAMDLGGGARLTILNPTEPGLHDVTNNPHSQMVVALLEYQHVKILFTGDAESEIENRLVQQYADLIDADVLKVGHHGSKTSTTENFLRAVTPQTAVIEVGAKNTYGHPTPTVLERLETFGIKYYRTDTDGTVSLISDGNTFQITKEK